MDRGIARQSSFKGRHTIDRLEERDVDKGIARQSSFKGRHNIDPLEERDVDRGIARQSSFKGRHNIDRLEERETWTKESLDRFPSKDVTPSTAWRLDSLP